MKREQKENYKEPFCGACATVPLAFVGAGVSAYGASSRDANKKKKQIMLWGGIVSIILTLLIGLYFWKTCSDCR